MKRLFPYLLALSLLLTCAGCGRAAAGDAHGAEDLSSQGAAKPPVEEPQDTDAEPSQPPEEPPEETSEEEEVPEEPYVRTIDPAGPMVALTFDDGPHQTYTDQILDILEEHHAVATFFEVGKNAARYPEPIARAAALGCEIGSHSNAHKDLSKLKSAALLADLDAADQSIAAAAGKAPTLLRPPYGAVNKTVKYSTGRGVVTWTVDTQDWLSQDAQKVIESLQSLESLDGEIVLLHSTYASTVEAMETVVPWLIEEGYQLVTVSELMAYYYGELIQPGQFYGYTYFTTHGRTDTPLQLPAEPETPSEEGTEAPPAEETPAPQPAAPQPSETPPAVTQPDQTPAVPVVQEPSQPATAPEEQQPAPPPADTQETPDLPETGGTDAQPKVPGQEAQTPPDAPELPVETPDASFPEEGAQTPAEEEAPPVEEAPADTEPPGWL